MKLFLKLNTKKYPTLSLSQGLLRASHQPPVDLGPWIERYCSIHFSSRILQTFLKCVCLISSYRRHRKYGKHACAWTLAWIGSEC